MQASKLNWGNLADAYMWIYICPRLQHALRLGGRRKARKISLRVFLGKCHMKDRNAFKVYYLTDKQTNVLRNKGRVSHAWEQGPSLTCLYIICSQTIPEGWCLRFNRKKCHLYTILKLLHTAFLLRLLQSFLPKQVKDFFSHFPCVSLYLMYALQNRQWVMDTDPDFSRFFSSGL